LYGIRNCDTVKKTRSWLETHGVQYDFHEMNVDGKLLVGFKPELYGSAVRATR